MPVLVRTLAVASLLALLSTPAAAEGPPIPVYPGAKLLVLPPEPGEEPECCTFVTPDPVAKVTAFYEKALGRKAHDEASLAKAYPPVVEMQKAMREALEEHPEVPQPKDLRVFVLEEMGQGRERMPTLTFAVGRLPQGTVFDVDADHLGAERPRWEEALHAQLGSERPEAGRLAEWERAHPPVQPARYDLPVYPNARVLHEERRSGSCYVAELATLDPYEKVVAYYRKALAGKLPEAPANGGPGDGRTFQFLDFRFAYDRGQDGEVKATLGKAGAVNRAVEIQYDAGSPLYVRMDPGTKAIEEVPATRIHFFRESLGKDCVAPRGPWKQDASVERDAYYGSLLGAQ